MGWSRQTLGGLLMKVILEFRSFRLKKILLYLVNLSLVVSQDG